MKQIESILIVLVLLLLTGSALVASEDSVEEQATEAALTWLAVVDDGKYAESWETAAEYFKNAVTKEEWQEALTAVRKPLGDLASRELSSREHRTSLPGAPDGEYVVIQFETSFENKRSAVETITPMLGEDGEWRVSGYFIK